MIAAGLFLGVVFWPVTGAFERSSSVGQHRLAKTLKNVPMCVVLSCVVLSFGTTSFQSGSTRAHGDGSILASFRLRWSSP